MVTEFGKTFAEQVSLLVNRANMDSAFRQELLKDPQKILQANHISCPEKICIEYHPDYGVYFAIEQPRNGDKATASNNNETLNATHFMDCHQ